MAADAAVAGAAEKARESAVACENSRWGLRRMDGVEQEEDETDLHAEDQMERINGPAISYRIREKLPSSLRYFCFLQVLGFKRSMG